MVIDQHKLSTTFRVETDLAHAIDTLDMAAPKLSKKRLGKHPLPSAWLAVGEVRYGICCSQFDRVESSLAV